MGALGVQWESDKQGRCPTVTLRHPCPTRGPTSVVDVPERRVDELPHVACPLGDVQEHRDGVITATAQIQQGLGQTGLPCGRLWGERHTGGRAISLWYGAPGLQGAGHQAGSQRSLVRKAGLNKANHIYLLQDLSEPLICQWGLGSSKSQTQQATFATYWNTGSSSREAFTHQCP